MAGRTPTSVRRRLAAGLLSWLLVAGVVRATVLLPEHCPPATVAQMSAAAQELSGWLIRNVDGRGRFLYRYDRDRAEVVAGYNLVRHAGAVAALYQAAEAGHAGALAAADRGLDFLLGSRLVRHDDWVAIAEGAGPAKVGTAALLVSALLTRRTVTGDRVHDELVVGLGSFLVAQQEPSGAIPALWDQARAAPVPDSYGAFATGEAAWALAQLHTWQPTAGWDEPARAVLRYLALERDDAEDRFPPSSDHWAAYAMAEIGRRWPAADASAPEVADVLDPHARRLAGIFGVQARWLAQRDDRDRWRRLVRGRDGLGAGEGTLIEGFAQLLSVSDRVESLRPIHEDMTARARCVAGRIADRLVAAGEAAADPEPSRVRGAIFTDGVTQVDDQQHALSGLLTLVRVLDPSRSRP